ncbi:AAA family ATPase [Haladaptatus sp. AB643]|uniref:AAA family ATPase n=1 Tax=Haladaptatus sp. AB643 TaxID=2934174 RepID=UPI00209C1492|nr:AAA family ATPase [Haladaptatus sp. AB643]MCO8242979.1 AAA family ATPase [Haladaptatus sp. AB643]
MSEPASNFEKLGFTRNPFDTTIADESIASQYKIVGRDDQEERLRRFVESGIREPHSMKRNLLYGEYGTGKSHHLLQLRDKIREGIEVDGEEHKAAPAYVSNLGLSIRAFYDRVIEDLIESAPELEDFIENLDPVEPTDSIEESFTIEKLKENIATNLRRIVQEAKTEYDYRALFIFVDEAEDIANAEDEQVRQFVRLFLHIVNELSNTPIHMLLGFSQSARTQITAYEHGEDTPLGNALIERFEQEPIILGDFGPDDAKEMLINRMNVHRMTNTRSIQPIVDETVEVVTRVSSGHPREILNIYSRALNYAADVDLDSIDGEAIVYALTGQKSLVRDEELLSQEAITNLRAALSDLDETLADDFERLNGRLIGEEDAIPQNAFEGDINQLLTPVSVGDDEMRILEESERHGQYQYTLSSEVIDYLFGGSSGSTTEIQQLDFKATKAPEKFQAELSRGMALALQQADLGTLHKNPVTTEIGRHRYSLYLMSIGRGDAKRDATVLIGLYNGQEIPKALVQLYVETIDSGKAAFGVLVKQNQQMSAETNNYLTNLDSQQRSYYDDRVVSFDISRDMRDNYVYGKFLARGDLSVEVEENLELGEVIETFEVRDELEKTFQDAVLPYPDDVYREVVRHLESEKDRDVTIGMLKDELDLTYELNSDIMNGLADQSLVIKSGSRWTYPDVEEDRPPWYEIYRLLKKEGAMTHEEIRDGLASEFVFECSSGDEGAMIQWYLDQLIRQGYVEISTKKVEGSKVDAYSIVSVTSQFNDTLDQVGGRLRSAEDLYETASNLKVKDVNGLENRLEDLDTRYNRLKKKIDPEHGDLTTARELRSEIVEFEEGTESAISTRKDAIIGDAKNVKDATTPKILDEIESANIEGEYASQLEERKVEIKGFQEELSKMIEAEEEYQRLEARTGEIETRIDEISDDIEKITGLKGRAQERLGEVRKIEKDAAGYITDISGNNPEKEKLESRLNDLETNLSEAEQMVNAGQFNKSLGLVDEDIKPAARKLRSDAKEISSDQEKYESRLNGLEADVKGHNEAEELYEQAESALNEGNFARVHTLIDEIQNLLKGPTRFEVFEAALRDHGGDLIAVIEDSENEFSETECFDFLKQSFQEGAIKDITVNLDR